MPEGMTSEQVQEEHERQTANVHDWEAIGKVLIDMIVNHKRPLDLGGMPINAGDIQVLEDFLNDEARPHQNVVGPAIEFPKHRLQTFRIEQSSWSDFVLRLPVPYVAKLGHDRVCPPDPTLEYNEPEFYEDKIVHGSIDNCQFFYCRVADYTMSMCK